MNRQSSKSESGFTLIELLVVIAIIGILSSVILTSVNSARIKARDGRRRSELTQLQLALELSYDANGSYPIAANFTEGRCNPPPNGWIRQPDYSGPTAWIPNLAPAYIPVLPGDPSVDPAGRCYVYWSDGQSYYIWAHLGAEGKFDPNDPMIRLLSPACTTAQNTFTVMNGRTRCN
jgi:prepilin-type N-terminal cleavage/methylation domain-containing protein